MDTAEKKQTAVKEAFEGIDRAKLAEALQGLKGSAGKKHICTRNYIDQIVGGHIVVSAKRAREIERLTLGRVPAKMLRPDIFGA